jgi:hypothetical protein
MVAEDCFESSGLQLWQRSELPALSASSPNTVFRYRMRSGLANYGSKCERDAPLLGIIDQHSDVEAELGWQYKDVARLLFAFLAE